MIAICTRHQYNHHNNTDNSGRTHDTANNQRQFFLCRNRLCRHKRRMDGRRLKRCTINAVTRWFLPISRRHRQRIGRPAAAECFQRFLHFLRCMPALLRIKRTGFQHNSGKRLIIAKSRRRQGFTPEPSDIGLFDFSRGNRRLCDRQKRCPITVEQTVHHQTERINIGGNIRRSAFGNFRRHITISTPDRHAHRVIVQHFGFSEIAQFIDTHIIDKDIRRFDITVNHVFAVEQFQCFTHRQTKLYHGLFGQGMFCHILCQWCQQFHPDKNVIADLTFLRQDTMIFIGHDIGIAPQRIAKIDFPDNLIPHGIAALMQTPFIRCNAFRRQGCLVNILRRNG